MPVAQQKKRVTFRNILFATDFSDAASAAMPFAAGLVKAFGAQLYMLHVLEPANYALPPEMWQANELAQEAKLKCLQDVIDRGFPEIAPQILQREGAVWSAVTGAVPEYGIDLIIVGTRGRTGIGKALLGSQAEEILRHATCPVLTVGPGAPSEVPAEGKFTSILYATNFGPASLSAAPLAISLAEEFQASLTLLHVAEKRDRSEGASLEEEVEASEQRLRALVPAEAASWCAPHFAVEHGDAAAKILDVAHRAGADLIVLGAARAEGLPGAATHLPSSTVHKIVAHAHCPVLTVR